jgi:asparagine synthase (glutamine-hydrolysing)
VQSAAYNTPLLPGLGHVRLSIIDLPSGHQPLSDEDEKIWAVVTGELYDFERIREELKAQGAQFKTNGDSELLVQLYKLYGLNAVLQMRGEFAFILWDDRRKHLFVGRDRFGIKPLYYVQAGNKLLVASEIKAFIPMGWTPEWDVDSIMNFGQYHDDRTNFRGVCKVSLALQTQLFMLHQADEVHDCASSDQVII